MVLSGLRGVGKTVLLNALRSLAVKRAWGTGKIEARPDQSLRLPLAQAVHAAVREVSHRHRDPERVDAVAGVLKSFALRARPRGPQGRPLAPAHRRTRHQGPRRLRRPRARPDRAVHRRRRARRGPRGGHRHLHRRDAGHPRARAGRAVRRGARDQPAGRPLLVVGAGLPHLPVALSASKSYAERLFRYVVVDRLPRDMADRALLVPASTEDVDYDLDALDELYRLTDGYPYFVQAYGKVTWDVAVELTGQRRPRGRAGGGGRARGRLLRRPLRPRHPGRARLHAHDGRARRGQRRRLGHHRRGRRRSAASRRASPRRATG